MSFRSLLLVALLACPVFCFAQLSKGEGEMVTLPGKTIRCYRPHHFIIQSEPPGIIHKETGTFIVAVKIPADKRVSEAEGLSRGFFEDPKYTITSFTEGKLKSLHPNDNRKVYRMSYTIQNFEFERHTMLVSAGAEQYLIIGNYYIKFKPQVEEEVEKVMSTFIIR